jgi:diketogulonate reductase-like aldo/keto reductase
VRWSVQHGYVPLPKSVRSERVAQNVDVFGFELSAQEMAALDALDERLFTEWEEWGQLDPTALP